MLLCTTALAADTVAFGKCGDDPEDDNVNWELYSDGTLEISGNGDTENYSETNRPVWERYDTPVTSVSVSGSVSALGSYIFYGCENLREVTVDSRKAINIYAYAFANSSVKTVNLSSIDEIYSTAFSGCTQLNAITCGKDKSHFQEFSDGNFPTSYYSLMSHLCHGRQFVKYAPNRLEYKYSIPNAMTSIAPYAFTDLQCLNEVGIPASVQEIGANAFFGKSPNGKSPNGDSLNYYSLKDVVFFGEAPKTVAANAFDFDGTIHCFCRYADSFRKSSLYNEAKGTWCSVPLEADLHKWVVDAKSGEIKCADCGTTEGLTFRNALPDPAFRSYMIRSALPDRPLDSNDNDAMTDEEVSKIVECINGNNLLYGIPNYFNSTEGLQLFLNKSSTAGKLEVNLSSQYLQTLSLSNRTSPWTLDCQNNQLKRLDLDQEQYPGLKSITAKYQYIYDETPVLQGDRYNNYHFNIRDLLGKDVDLSRIEITDKNATLNKETGEVTYNSNFAIDHRNNVATYDSAPTAVHYTYDTGFVNHYDDNTEAKAIMDVTWTPKTQQSADLVTKGGHCGGTSDGSDLDYEWSEETGVLTITGKGDMWDYHNKSNIYGEIPWASFNIKKLVVGEGCTSINAYAFWQKRSIEEVVFLCDTLNIGEYAFFDCEALKSVDFSKCNNLTLGDDAFSGCIQLSSITFNDSDTAVIKPGQYVFSNCRALSTVHLPKGVTMDGTYNSGLGMFSGCTSLKTAMVDCAYIGPMTFECGSLDRITFTDPDVKFYYFDTGKEQSGHPINVACQTELVGYDCSEVHKLVNEKYKSNGVSLTFKQIEGDTGEHKNVVTVPAVAATCISTGSTKGSRCSDCDTWIVEPKETPMLEHTPVVDVGSAPTVGKAGKTDGSHCSECNGVIVAQEEIPAWVTAVKYEDGQLTVTVSGDAAGQQLILAAYRENGQLSQLFLPAASSSGTYTLTVDAATDFKWKAFFADSAFAPAQYAYELPLL